jgi:murE/murF fusion protein
MLLGDYFKNINSNYKKFFFSGISFNSNKILKDNIFFAIKGNNVNGLILYCMQLKKEQKLLLQSMKMKD